MQCTELFVKFTFPIDMIDSAEIVRASWTAKFKWNTKKLLSRFRTSETVKLSNLGSFMLLNLIIESGERIYKVFRHIQRIIVLLIKCFV